LRELLRLQDVVIGAQFVVTLQDGYGLVVEHKSSRADIMGLQQTRISPNRSD
jgi:hypothetical protein